MSDEKESRIVCNNNGPLRVMGENIVLQDAAGNTFGLGGRTVISLCRCGASANKPFCDGSHKAHNFQSAERALMPPPPTGTA